jgi:hypothetical protein
VQAYSVDNDTEAHVMTVNLVDYRVSPAARLGFLAAPRALAGVLNSSGCSNQAATTALPDSSPTTVAALPEAQTGFATPATKAIRQLDPTLSRMPMDDAAEMFDHHQATGISS